MECCCAWRPSAGPPSCCPAWQAQLQAKNEEIGRLQAGPPSASSPAQHMRGCHVAGAVRVRPGVAIGATIVGSQGSGPGQFNRPLGVAVDAEGNLVVADTGNDRVQVLRPDGSHVRTIGGSQGSGPGQFNCPGGVAVDAEGNLVVADTLNHRVQVLR